MSASLDVFGNVREYDTDLDVFGNVFEWESGDEPDPVFTTSLELVGVNAKRSVPIGQSSQRLLHRGATKRQNTLEGASR